MLILSGTQRNQIINQLICCYFIFHLVADVHHLFFTDSRMDLHWGTQYGATSQHVCFLQTEELRTGQSQTTCHDWKLNNDEWMDSWIGWFVICFVYI